nr:RNA-directed DNA polymerase, eukaryota [Tanacetum cinerariifolium]
GNPVTEVLLKLILPVHRIRRRRYNLIPAESKFKNLMLDHQDKYMMKAQVHVSKSSAISDKQALPRRKHYCQMINFTSGVMCFFDKGRFPRGSNSSFIALIPKVMDAKFVTDFRPISLIGSVYKVVTKILANRLTTEEEASFGFKVDFAKAYDSVRCDFLLDVLLAFGFGLKWCQWIRGIFSSNMASILINESPSSEFPIFSGLKQGDPLASFLFILVMESLYLSVTRAVNDGIFKGLRITGSSSLSHLFYADDAVFIGEWSIENLDNLLKILNYFHLASGLCINVNKSHVLGVGVPLNIVRQG